MLSRRSWAFVRVLAPSLVSCLPAEELSSYSRGSGGMLGGGGSSQAISNPPSPTAGGPSEVPEAGSGALDASVTDGGAADGGVPPPGRAPEPDAGRDGGAPRPPACGVAEVSGPSGDCFVEVATLASWSDARAACQALGTGWDLATFRSAEDTAFWAPRLTFEAWVGASDATNEGVWVWVADGAQFWVGDGLTGAAVNGAYTSWNTNEPNGGEGSDCARVLPRTMALPERNAPWADLECTELLGALCEGPPR